ncbi:MAG: phosphatase PAP2 family protein [Eubacterium sp.]|nr:phosphatase PAP2 family protein [Eubacterium sp.]
MTQETYIKITEKIRSTHYGERIIVFINRLLTDIVYIAFLALLVYLALHRDKDIIKIVIVTGISFVLVSIIRHFINAERPYTKYEFIPLVQKEKKGDSMPSRHVFSAFVIGMAFMYIHIVLGTIILFIGCFMAVIRVIVGVHFPRDVIAGAVIGILSGIIGFYLI